MRTDSNERLLAVATQPIGDVPSIATLFSLLFAFTGAVAYIAARTFLRKYFLFSEARSHTVQEALRLGEGESIEFKRSISFDSAGSVEQLLQTVAAFANSGDGTIFIGIEDEGQVKGISAASPKERDQALAAHLSIGPTTDQADALDSRRFRRREGLHRSARFLFRAERSRCTSWTA